MARSGVRADAMLVAVSRLVDKPLLPSTMTTASRAPACSKQYARARLAEAGEEPAARERHLDYFLELVAE